AMANINCMFCGQENARGTERCGRCSRALPAMPGEPDRSSFSAVQTEEAPQVGKGQVTENYARLEMGFKALVAGAIDNDDLQGMLEQIEGKMLAHQADNLQ